MLRVSFQRSLVIALCAWILKAARWASRKWRKAPSPNFRRTSGSLLSAYTRGVNAFIDSHRDRLPLEFLIVRYQPKPWRDFDSVAVALNLATALSQTWESDLMREHVAAKLGQELFARRVP